MRWILVSLITAATVSAFADRPDRNSFIDYPIHSTADLIRQIQKDPAVADRYERNFSMTEDQVIQMIQGLHLGTLSETANFDVYSVPPDGHIKWHQQRLKKGTPIFADASGKPTMLLKCGNPLVMSSPTPGGPPVAGPSAPMEGFDTPPAETPNPDMAMAPPPATPEDVYVPPAAEPLAPAAAAFTGVGGAAGGAPNLGWLGFLAAGGIIYGLTTIHGGSSHTPPPTPVPEPANLMVIGCGLTGVLLSNRKRKN